MGCLALEYRARALLGMVGPHARWFSPSWSWSSSGFVAEAAGCGLRTVLCGLSLSQPSPSLDDVAEEGWWQSEQGCRQGPLQSSLGWWDLVLGCRSGEGGPHPSPCPGQCWFCSTAALPCSPQSAAAWALQGTSTSFWCEQGPVPIISSLLWGRYWSCAGVGWETPAT